MPEPSEILVNQTSTAVPNWGAALLAVFLVLAIYRLTALGDWRGTTTAANWYAIFITCYALTRFEVIQGWLMTATGASLSDIRVLGSAADVAAALALLLLAIRWRSATGLTSRNTWVAAVAVGVLSVCALVVLNAPAHAENIAIEEVGGWRSAAYITIYSGLFFIPAEALIVATLLQMALNKDSDWKRRALVLCLFLAIGVSVISLTTRVAAAWLVALGIETGLHTDRTSLANDLAFYPSVVWLLPVGLPAVFVDIRRRLGLAQSRVKRSTDRIRPLWVSLIAVAPSAVLADDTHVENEAEIHHRMRVEIEDVIGLVAAYLPSGTYWPDDAAARAKLLARACETYLADVGPARPPAPPAWASSEDAVDEVADVWPGRDLDEGRSDELAQTAFI